MKHTGWYTNEDGTTYKDGSGLCRGIVASLTHNRFIAGYHWGDDDERVWFSEIYTDEESAARAADQHAEQFAETQREDDARFNAMHLAEFDAEEKTIELQKALVLRNIPNFGGRDRVRNYLEKLREARKELNRAIKEYEGRTK